MTEKERDKLSYEYDCMASGMKYIAGCDEVGRGPLAGPVLCCAVIMPLNEGDIIEGVDDSKKLSSKKREKLSEKILERAVAVCICGADPAEIDSINILEATKKCMRECVKGLTAKPDVLLCDALDIETDGVPCVPIIKGDAKSYTIGCASIVAKVCRDKLMEDYAHIYPGYAFEKNKGYGTAEHIQAIKDIGPCAIHRRSFIKNFYREGNENPKKTYIKRGRICP